MKPVQRALVALLLDQHGISARQQTLVDEIERLQRAGDDQDVIGGAVDPGVTLELCGEELAQGAIALRPVGEIVRREVLALALQHGIDRIDKSVDRNLVGVIVAANEAVFCEPRPPRCRRRQPGRKQRREIE